MIFLKIFTMLIVILRCFYIIYVEMSPRCRVPLKWESKSRSNGNITAVSYWRGSSQEEKTHIQQSKQEKIVIILILNLTILLGGTRQELQVENVKVQAGYII